MSKDIARTIYFDPELDAIITQRKDFMGRKRSAEVERLIRKALKYEAEQNEAALPKD